jgi:hypothetical protein
MEQTLEVYHRPRDPRRPLVCLDECSKPLLAESRPSLPAAAGRPARIDYEYIRHGVASDFMLLAPLEGWREVAVTGTKTRLDYARVLQALADQHFPEAEKIVLVQDNLNTHHPSSLYEAFPPAEVRRLLERFEFHYTPKHGSWLNMAETELSVLNRQSLDGRIGSLAQLEQQIAAWQRRRNAEAKSYQWQFTTEDARTKLHRLYPSTQA